PQWDQGPTAPPASGSWPPQAHCADIPLLYRIRGSPEMRAELYELASYPPAPQATRPWPHSPPHRLSFRRRGVTTWDRRSHRASQPHSSPSHHVTRRATPDISVAARCRSHPLTQTLRPRLPRKGARCPNLHTPPKSLPENLGQRGARQVTPRFLDSPLVSRIYPRAPEKTGAVPSGEGGGGPRSGGAIKHRALGIPMPSSD